jgi:hypothetical protein
MSPDLITLPGSFAGGSGSGKIQRRPASGPAGSSSSLNSYKMAC